MWRPAPPQTATRLPAVLGCLARPTRTRHPALGTVARHNLPANLLCCAVLCRRPASPSCAATRAARAASSTLPPRSRWARRSLLLACRAAAACLPVGPWVGTGLASLLRPQWPLHLSPQVVNGNYVTAKRRGIVNGVDFGGFLCWAGLVRCRHATGIHCLFRDFGE